MAASKVALVTGAGSGIGKAAAVALAKAGYGLVLAGRRMEPLDRTAGDIRSGGGKALAIVTDVGNPDSVKALFAKAKQEMGRLDLLFNNAGGGTPPVPIEDLTFAQWSGAVAANLTGAFLCTQEAFRLMKAQSPQGGRIINNGSISAHAPRPNSAPYTSTKHAITGLTKSCALDGRAFNITCGQIDIGNAETEMTQRMKGGVLQANGSTAVEPLMDVQHVADAIVHMASLPPSANILFLTVMASKMPFVGRG